MKTEWVINWYARDTLCWFYWDGYDWNPEIQYAKRYASEVSAKRVRTRLKLTIGYPEKLSDFI